jgi:hypothetical protein
MRLEQANQLAILKTTRAGDRKQQSISAAAVVRKVYESGQFDEPQSVWAKKWLASDRFVLLEIEASRVAAPFPHDAHTLQLCLRASADSLEPIVVDVNKRQVGRTTGRSKYIPPIIVLAGVERHKAQMQQGRERVRAWVGVKAMRKLFGAGRDAIFGASEFSSSELQSRLGKLLREKYPGSGRNASTLSSYGSSDVWVRDVFPLESYCIFNHDGKLWKQFFKVEDAGGKSEIMLDGVALEVREAYIDASREKKSKVEVAACMGTGMLDPHVGRSIPPTFGATNSALNMGINAAEKKKIKRMLVDYNDDISAGRWAPKKHMMAKSPPGWEDDVEKMKDDHPEIDNPWALTWWMKDKGYTPHNGKSKGKK